MEEYEVRDVSMRAEAPALTLTFRLASMPVTAATPQGAAVTHLDISPVIANEAPTPAEYIVINIFVDTRLLLPKGYADLHLAEHEDNLAIDGRDFECKILSMNHGIPSKIPIFQGATFSLLQKPLTIGLMEPGKYVLGSRLLSPRMSQKLQASFLVWDGTQANIVAAN